MMLWPEAISADHLLDHVAQAAAIPEMVMRIDDRARGIDDLLGVLREPVFARIGVEPALRGGCSAGGHEFRSLFRLAFVGSFRNAQFCLKPRRE